MTGLALDWITKNLYLAYKSPKGSRKLGIININRSKGFTSNKIIDLDFNVTNPTSIVVYPQKRLVNFSINSRWFSFSLVMFLYCFDFFLQYQLHFFDSVFGIVIEAFVLCFFVFGLNKRLFITYFFLQKNDCD